MNEFQNQLQMLNVDDFQVSQPVLWEQNQQPFMEDSRLFGFGCFGLGFGLGCFGCFGCFRCGGCGGCFRCGGCGRCGGGGRCGGCGRCGR
ncbi:heterocycloanthracin/sonorensin family bacteriocin [Peribacillus butanolivorans]|uniref:heterocycloanthracin/sonorensin family bacteriocin n=1 Tax=Peribacillus butanolivorans TaxID=421767 RepID=UPI0036DE1B4D